MSSPETLYRLCPRCQGAGQVSDERSERVGFLSLPCPDCTLLRVVPVSPTRVEPDLPLFREEINNV